MTIAVRGQKGGIDYKPVLFDPPGITADRRDDGSLLLRAERSLAEVPVHYGTVLDHWAAQRPDLPALAQWQGDGNWATLSWRDFAEQARAAAAGLLSLGLPRERPFVIFAQPSLAHGVIMFAAMQAGLIFAPVAPAYAMDGADQEKLDHVLRLLDPPLVFVDDGPRYEAMLGDRLPRDVPVFHFERPLASRDSRPWRDLLGSPADPAIDRARAGDQAGRLRQDTCSPPARPACPRA